MIISAMHCMFTKTFLLPNMEMPLISVLMTAYNREKYIADAIESVLASTYTRFELIIVDDCSTDNTVLIARNFERKDSRIRVFVNEKNLGDYPNRNRAASYAKGEFLLYLDSDDKIYKEGLERCINVMLAFPDASFGMRLFNKECEPFEINSEEVIQKHFFESSILTIGPGGTILKKAFFDAIGQYPVKYGPANDMYFNLKAACQTKMVLIPFEYMFYRRHEGQEINNRFSYLYNNYLYLKDALNELDLHLAQDQIRWLQLKNKRRFFVNLIKFFAVTFNARKIRFAILKTGFNFRDVRQAIFQ